MCFVKFWSKIFIYIRTLTQLEAEERAAREESQKRRQLEEQDKKLELQRQVKQQQEEQQRKMREEMIKQEIARKVKKINFQYLHAHMYIIQAEEQRKKMERDAELLKQKLLEEQKRREVCDDHCKPHFYTGYQEEMLAAEAEWAKQEEEKLQAQKQIESVSSLTEPSNRRFGTTLPLQNLKIKCQHSDLRSTCI